MVLLFLWRSPHFGEALGPDPHEIAGAEYRSRRLLGVVSITSDVYQEGAKGRSASGVRMSRGTSKSRAAPRICSAGFGKPERRL